MSFEYVRDLDSYIRAVFARTFESLLNGMAEEHGFCRFAPFLLGLIITVTLLGYALCIRSRRACYVYPYIIVAWPWNRFGRRNGMHASCESSCPICLEPSTIITTATCDCDCKTLFHRHCLNKWLQRASTCPCCRKELRVAKQHEHQQLQQQQQGSWMTDLSVFMGFPPTKER
jgi:hypothetical protein